MHFESILNMFSSGVSHSLHKLKMSYKEGGRHYKICIHLPSKFLGLLVVVHFAQCTLSDQITKIANFAKITKMSKIAGGWLARWLAGWRTPENFCAIKNYDSMVLWFS